MPSSAAKSSEQRDLLVLALGGNALSPPAGRVDDYAVERQIVAATGKVLNRLSAAGLRLLIVHGNGPQVGRLLRTDPSHGNLDVHVAQTQGELGYLLAAHMNAPTACVLTRVVVADEIGPPVKPIGPVMRSRPADAENVVRAGDGWRVVVASPAPVRVVEWEAIAGLLASNHVIAGGGGGIPVTREGAPVSGVVDKDRVASLLAVTLDARHCVFATDVDGVYRRYPEPDAEVLESLSTGAAREMISSGAASAGSMAPKLEGAIAFCEATGRSAQICHLNQIEEALAGGAGTRIVAETAADSA